MGLDGKQTPEYAWIQSRLRQFIVQQQNSLGAISKKSIRLMSLFEILVYGLVGTLIRRVPLTVRQNERSWGHRSIKLRGDLVKNQLAGWRSESYLYKELRHGGLHRDPIIYSRKQQTQMAGIDLGSASCLLVI